MKAAIVSLGAIAVNTFREAIRNKVLASLLFFGVVLAVTSSLLGQMSLHHEGRVATNFSILFSTLFAVIIGIHSMVTLLHTELERRTLYTLLSKPISRWQFFVGKYLGVVALLVVVTAIMLAVSTLLVVVQGGALSPAFFWSFFTILLQLMIIVAITAFFSTISSPLLAGMFSASFFIIGNLISQLRHVKTLLADTTPAAGTLVDAAIVLLPNFEELNLSGFAAVESAVPMSYLLSATWYAASLSAAILFCGTVAFERKDFQ